MLKENGNFFLDKGKSGNGGEKQGETLVSIIVPVYMVEKYLSRCVDSLLNQAYTNIEIILVDDGSTDGCPSICDEYQENYERVSVIHKSNGGLSDARNKGIEASKGDYISFIDSDDYVHPEMIRKMVDLLESEEADIAVCNYYWISEDDEIPKDDDEYKITIIEGDCHRLLFEKTEIAAIACNKLYKKRIFDSIRFPEGKYHEDEYVIHHILGASTKVVCTNERLYYYIKRESSITGQISTKRISDSLGAFEDRMDYYECNQLYDYYARTCQIWIRMVTNFYNLLMVSKITDEKKTRVLLKNSLKDRLSKMRTQNVIKTRYYLICRLWCDNAMIGNLLLSIYDNLSGLKHIRENHRI